MAWVKMPCVNIGTLSDGWHVESQTPIMLGSWANVECISSVWRPAGADSRVVVDEAFSTKWCNQSFVEFIRDMDLLVGTFAWVMG